MPPESEILIGEADAIGYDALQDELGYLTHGADDWLTVRVPKSIAAAEVAQLVRYLNMVFGAALMAAPFMFTPGIVATIVSVALGAGLLALSVLSVLSGLIRQRYGNWDRMII